MLTSPTIQAPSRNAGRGTLTGVPPQTARMICSLTISAPMVIRIWRRWSR